MPASIPFPALYLAALLAGASYWPASHWLSGSEVLTIWKGAGVALLALWAAVSARGRSGRLLVGVMACGAAGDVLLETHGLIAGAIAFLAGHILAVLLYRANGRAKRDGTAIAIAIAVVMLVPLAAYALSGQPGVLLYALGLGAMAATAWVSRFPRGQVALGALMFVASDLLIFARLHPMPGSAVAGLLIWPLYFAGQALIAYGVVTTLRQEARG